MYNCYLLTIFVSLSNLWSISQFYFLRLIYLLCIGPNHTNYFPILQSLEGNNLVDQHLCDYYLTHVYTFAYCWTHVV
jgi:hypothetical protein